MNCRCVYAITVSLAAMSANLSVRAASQDCAAADPKTIAAARGFVKTINTGRLEDVRKVVVQSIAPQIQIRHVPASPDADRTWNSAEFARGNEVELKMAPLTQTILEKAGLRNITAVVNSSFAEGSCVVSIRVQHAEDDHGELVSTIVSKTYMKGDKIVGVTSYFDSGWGAKYSAALAASPEWSALHAELVQIQRGNATASVRATP